MIAPIHFDRLCKNCKHMRPYQTTDAHMAVQLAECTRTTLIVNLVDGSARHRFCENERTSTAPGACGVDGAHFEPDNSDIIP